MLKVKCCYCGKMLFPYFKWYKSTAMTFRELIVFNLKHWECTSGICGVCLKGELDKIKHKNKIAKEGQKNGIQQG